MTKAELIDELNDKLDSLSTTAAHKMFGKLTNAEIVALSSAILDREIDVVNQVQPPKAIDDKHVYVVKRKYVGLGSGYATVGYYTDCAQAKRKHDAQRRAYPAAAVLTESYDCVSILSGG